MPQLENPGSGIAVFRFQNFRLFQVARFCVVLATEMQSVAVGWQIYETTKRPLDLGPRFCFFWFPATSSIASIAATFWCCAIAALQFAPLCCSSSRFARRAPLA